MSNQSLIPLLFPTLIKLILNESFTTVLDQSYTKWECVIVNDGSLDNTEEIFRLVYKGQRFRYVKREWRLVRARNAGIEISIGEVLMKNV
jgi:glycosyltransferase involved in cell wall biosynthesis